MRQLSLFAEPVLPRQQLPTNLTTNRHPVHRWFNFIAGFSPEFVSACIRNAGLPSDHVLLDPFAGLGTALVQASLEGINSVGFESHPFFCDIARVKIDPPRSEDVVNQIEAALMGLEPFAGDLLCLWSRDAATFLGKVVPEGDLRLLASALMLEPRIPAGQRLLYRLVVSRVLEHAASSATDGIYKAPTTRKKGIPFADGVVRVCAEIRADIPAITGSWRGMSKIYQASSEDMRAVADGACSICITSPPYLNNFDFAEMTRMDLYFWRYANSWREITESVRRKLIVNTTTAPSDLRRDQRRFARLLTQEFLDTVQPIVAQLRATQHARAGKKDYHSLVVPYFAQMNGVLGEVARVLRPGSSFHLVVADAALYGVHIETQLLLARLMEESSFEIVQIERLRTRGDRWMLKKRQGSTKPLGEFHVHARRR